MKFEVEIKLIKVTLTTPDEILTFLPHRNLQERKKTETNCIMCTISSLLDGTQ